MKRVPMTLVLASDSSRILLALKKRGFGEGRWNGFGGKVKDGETPEQAAVRETYEECGVRVTELEKRGLIDFTFKDKPDETLEVHIFKALSYKGVPQESEEMRPKWYPHEEIPFAKMWPDDEVWMPHFLEDKLFKGHVHFQDQNTILHHTIEQVREL